MKQGCDEGKMWLKEFNSDPAGGGVSSDLFTKRVAIPRLPVDNVAMHDDLFVINDA